MPRLSTAAVEALSSRELKSAPAKPAAFWMIAGAAVLIFLITLKIYGPMIQFPIYEADQMDYFTEMKGSRSLADGFALQDYALKREHAKGDEFLYRPLLFDWLAVQNTLFTYHYTYWNAATILLHLAVVFLLFKVFWQMSPGFPAALFAVCFASSPDLPYLVTRTHAGGYFWGIGLFLFALGALLRMVNRAEPQAKDLYAYVLSMTAAGFFLDAYMVISTAMAALALVITLITQKRIHLKWLFVFIPFSIFITVYSFRAMHAQRLFFVDGGGYDLFSTDRLDILPAWILACFKTWVLTFLSNVTWRGALPAVGLSLIYLCLLSFEHLKKNIFSLLAFPGAVLLYAFILCFMRQMVVSHHNYFLVIFIYLFAYSTADWKRLTRPLRWAGILFSAFFLVQNSYFSVSAMKTLAPIKGAEVYASELTHFVDSRKGEKDFSFKVLNPPEEIDDLHEMPVGYPDDPKAPIEKRYWSDIMFQPYWKTAQPKYELIWQNPHFKINPPAAPKNQQS